MASFNAGGERRRRVLTEQMAAAPGSGDVCSTVEDKSVATIQAVPPASYPVAVLANQPRVTDFIARRYSILSLWFLLGALAIGSIITAYAYLPEIGQHVPSQFLTSLDLAARGSLAAWFCSLALTAAALGSLVIYSLRRQKADDYQGRYRVWIWGAIGWWLLSIDAVTGLHRDLSSIAVQLSKRGEWAGGAAWWLTPALLGLAFLMFRLVPEIKTSRLGLTALLLAFGCWLSAMALRLGWVPVPSAAIGTMLGAGVTMGGHLLLLAALGCYARHVALEVEGLLPVKAPKAERSAKVKPAKAKPEPEAAKSARASKLKAEPATEPVAAKASKGEVEKPTPKTEPAHTAKSEAAASSVAWTDGSDGEDEDDEANRKLNKAERRRLRKLRTEQSRAA